MCLELGTKRGITPRKFPYFCDRNYRGRCVGKVDVRDIFGFETVLTFLLNYRRIQIILDLFPKDAPGLPRPQHSSVAQSSLADSHSAWCSETGCGSQTMGNGFMCRSDTLHLDVNMCYKLT